MKFFKGNQVVIYIIALMLITAGYLNYTTNNKSLQTSTSTEQNSTKVGDIGDATFVSSNDVVTNESSIQNTSNTANNTNNANVANNTNSTYLNSNTNSSSVNLSNIATSTNNSSNNSEDYFIKSKLERDNMYSQMLETYNKVLNSTNSSETQKQSATDEITKINGIKNSIMICENLIKTKGFENSVVFVNGESINVIIGTDTLEKEEVAQIQNIIERELNASATNIHIATK